MAAACAHFVHAAACDCHSARAKPRPCMPPCARSVQRALHRTGGACRVAEVRDGRAAGGAGDRCWRKKRLSLLSFFCQRKSTHSVGGGLPVQGCVISPPVRLRTRARKTVGFQEAPWELCPARGHEVQHVPSDHGGRGGGC